MQSFQMANATLSFFAIFIPTSFNILFYFILSITDECIEVKNIVHSVECFEAKRENQSEPTTNNNWTVHTNAQSNANTNWVCVYYTCKTIESIDWQFNIIMTNIDFGYLFRHSVLKIMSEKPQSWPICSDVNRPMPSVWIWFIWVYFFLFCVSLWLVDSIQSNHSSLLFSSFSQIRWPNNNGFHFIHQAPAIIIFHGNIFTLMHKHLCICENNVGLYVNIFHRKYMSANNWMCDYGQFHWIN